jgi:hypothetical protein
VVRRLAGRECVLLSHLLLILELLEHVQISTAGALAVAVIVLGTTLLRASNLQFCYIMTVQNAVYVFCIHVYTLSKL